MEILLAVCIGLVVYTYIGYGILVWLLVRLRGRRAVLKTDAAFTPEVTLIIPAYNERSCLAEKAANSFAQHYPADKIKFLFVTEGSTDGSSDFLRASYGSKISLLEGTERRGKVAAMNRAMQQVTTPIAIFTDANTILNREAVQNLVRHFQDPNVGAVAGEKRILTNDSESAAGSGEGLYWKYESFLKRMDSDLHTIVGAAGELFAVRTELYEPVETDTILDDFIISLRIAGRGYRVAYEPDAYAMERPSFSIVDEQKRKIRISAGGFQSIVRLSYLLNIFRYGWLTFEYVSHRVMRWAVAPPCLPLIFLANGWLAVQEWMDGSAGGYSWTVLFGLQCLFYAAAWLGYRLEKKNLRWKLLFVPFYFTFMNVCALAGLVRYLKGNQSGTWEKVRRAGEVELKTP
ncbi:cellulose synthase/poly-beta-1,6-N-acetylglucosamine synthase-like glycosyltransferase [Larkinella arboricola]|uniref:Cellulose synthase/poly-beta-1,6-N-acetylglucosamine synthase-like glycosyltransferase n=1 Tax=Larkinella arboricola TaxID=643671 RepID=A0A327WRX3_LARAB|nr:glycosyltransferase family 2 protein [Larkinella arboricola]RAJ93977.1 cellulose synthase/poly-beta-1,6-N-acetylglucosamine synthase-like glycosyltransferase [Larkinella arboricola]